MPAKPQWLLQLPAILDTLDSLPSPVVDRLVIEKVFGVGRRRAILLLHSFGGFRSGQTFFIERQKLINQLQRIREGEEFTGERQRRNRLARDLEQSHQLSPGRNIGIAAADDVRERQLADLPRGIDLKPGELTVEFSGAEDLLRQLFELSQAILNNYAAFEDLVSQKNSTCDYTTIASIV